MFHGITFIIETLNKLEGAFVKQSSESAAVTRASLF